MPASHTIFCALSDCMKKLVSKSDNYYVSPHSLMQVIVAQNACIDELNARLHDLEQRVGVPR